MSAELLCAAALILTFFCARGSIGTGLVALLTVGYAYGIVRANLAVEASHFIFDAAVLGLYAGVFVTPASRAARTRCLPLQAWVAGLTLWPLLMFFVPVQDWLIQLTGLRAAVFFVPLLLVGARMEEQDFHTLAAGLAVLNIAELGFATAEYILGIQPFFPVNSVTELIYRSADVAGNSFRIPATFGTSATYGGAMAFSMPVLADAWGQPSRGILRRRLLEVGLIASGLGVFLSASRTSAVLVFCLVVVMFTSLRMKVMHRAVLIAILLLITSFVAKDARLQRFTTLADAEMVRGRILGSVNSTFIDVLLAYPMGNGLGGGGTSIPHFLQERLRNPVLIENEYGRILAEQGVLGLLLWLAFVFWVLIYSWPGRQKDWRLGSLLLWTAAAFAFVSAPLANGLLTAIPGTAMLLVSCGWLIGHKREGSMDRPEQILTSRIEPVATPQLAGNPR
jgi:hypothetical protein